MKIKFIHSSQIIDICSVYGCCKTTTIMLVTAKPKIGHHTLLFNCLWAYLGIVNKYLCSILSPRGQKGRQGDPDLKDPLHR